MALIGANFGLALHPVDRKGIHIPGEPASCFASFWVADWSRWGTGTVLMVATLQGWRSYGSNEFFASSLATELTRFFPEAARFPLAGSAIPRTSSTSNWTLNAGSGPPGGGPPSKSPGAGPAAVLRTRLPARARQRLDEQHLPSVQHGKTRRVRRRMARRPHCLPRPARSLLLRVHGGGRVLGDVTAWFSGRVISMLGMLVSGLVLRLDGGIRCRLFRGRGDDGHAT